MRKLDNFWLSNESWYHWTESGARVINDDAPLEAQESYKRYLEQAKAAEDSVKSGRSMD
ncbi:MAG: hypothetical protein J6S92_14015 [Oscillospiraceae bacterium]|nr:hypothetical protein [Oscillospiraceae bacterium]MBP0989372.1 hypothetical protein [Oscillospiraceae bacterium]